MNITINGKIMNVLPPRKGVSKTGNEWVSQDFVIESEDGDSICFNMFGADKIQQSGLKLGVKASVTCKIESKEWNNKWFTSISCISCIVQGGAKQPTSQPKPPQQAVDFGTPTTEQTSIDSLPF